MRASVLSHKYVRFQRAAARALPSMVLRPLKRNVFARQDTSPARAPQMALDFG